MLKAGPLVLLAAMTVTLGGAWLLRGGVLSSLDPVLLAPWAVPQPTSGERAGMRAGRVSTAVSGTAAETDSRRNEIHRQLEDISRQIAEDEGYLAERSKELDRLSDPQAEESLQSERSDLSAQIAQLNEQSKSQQTSPAAVATEAAKRDVFAKYAAEEAVRAENFEKRRTLLENESAALERQAERVEAMRAALREAEAAQVVTDRWIALQAQEPIEARRLAEMQAKLEALSRDVAAADAMDERERRWEERADQERLRQQAGRVAGESQQQLQSATRRNQELEKQESERQQQRVALSNEVNEVRRRIDELEHRKSLLQVELEASPQAS